MSVMASNGKMEIDSSKSSVMATPGTTGSVSVAIHPLVIMNISDHWTRVRAQYKGSSQEVLGALIGKQSGRKIEVCNSFEFLWKVEADGSVAIDMPFYRKKEDQYKQVFSDLDFIGWYSTGAEPTPGDIKVHKQLFAINESPIFMKLDPLSRKSELPVTVVESVVDLVNGEATVLFVELPYSLATEEAERIGVDHVARVSATESGGSASSSVAHNLTPQYSAIQMLHVRVKMMLQYVRATQLGELPTNHDVMRDLYSLIHRLPVMAGRDFKQDFSQQCSDVELMAYLGAMTKGCDTINQFINKFNVLYDRQGSRRPRGMMF